MILYIGLSVQNVVTRGNNNVRNVKYLKRGRLEPSETAARITNEAYNNEQSDYSRLIPNERTNVSALS